MYTHMQGVNMKGKEEKALMEDHWRDRQAKV